MEKKARLGRITKILTLFVIGSVFIFACKGEPKSIPPQKLVVPIFNADSAYSFIEKQLSYGPRTPGSEAQIKTRDWMVAKLKSYGATVEVQAFEGVIFNGETKPGYNIIAQFNPKEKNRVLLGAHWDTRIVADKDTERKDEPIMGADDGASGVAALIEIARNVQMEPLNLGVDIILFDLEDQGSLDGEASKIAGDTWTIGSAFWKNNITPPGYEAKFGILLDMIAAKGAVFGREQNSTYYAKEIQDKIWDLAKKMGKGNLFQDYNSGPIADDHIHVIAAGIPMVDIINRPMKNSSGFGHYHHTHKDDIDIISKDNLKAVGQVVTAIIYREAVGRF